MKKAEQILNKYIKLHNKGTHVQFINYQHYIFEKYNIDDADWDKVFMWDENPRKTLLKQITHQLKGEE